MLCHVFFVEGQCNSDSFQGNSGWFTSPNYPCLAYNNNHRCAYSIVVSSEKYVELTVVDFDTENGYDYLYVSEYVIPILTNGLKKQFR